MSMMDYYQPLVGLPFPISIINYTQKLTLVVRINCFEDYTIENSDGNKALLREDDCSNEGPRLLSIEDNIGILKIPLTLSSPEPLDQFQANLAQDIPFSKGGYSEKEKMN